MYVWLEGPAEKIAKTQTVKLLDVLESSLAERDRPLIRLMTLWRGTGFAIDIDGKTGPSSANGARLVHIPNETLPAQLIAGS